MVLYKWHEVITYERYEGAKMGPVQATMAARSVSKFKFTKAKVTTKVVGKTEGGDRGV